ncbi:MAG: hypothetical protein A2Z19_02840 [Deltaproteobacteria bacterium RBG_16_54_18]|nr:MAG: hypothetical protein A2Z19_02840 [Deltaproteobacteria bacterium RBG_16_54_18]
MRKFLVLFVLLGLIGLATTAHAQEQAPAPAVASFDKDRLLERLADVKPFQSEKGGAGSGYAFFVKKEEFRESLLFLAPEKVDGVMKDFGMAVAFSFKDNTQFLILTQWRDNDAAKNFMKVRDEQWRLTDAAYKQYITGIEYKELDIAADTKALVTRKTISQTGQRQPVTTFVSARKDYFFECTLLGMLPDDEVKKLIVRLWKIIEPFTDRAVR